jgi:hypothetical protein
MATTPEGKVKKAVRQVLDGLGAYYVMPVTGGYGKQGAPDFLVCHKGLFFGIETKAGKGKLTTLQELNLKKIIEAGGVALVVREDDVQYLAQILSTGECNETEERITSK